MEYNLTVQDLGEWGFLLVAEIPSHVCVSKQIQSLIGRSLLKEGLKRLGIYKGDLIYGYEAKGKPYLKNYSGCFFNISHCKEAVVCVITQREVGVDVESISEENLEILHEVMNDEEVCKVKNAFSPVVTFTEFWTKKESLLKCTGEGLCEDLKPLLNERRFHFYTIKSQNLSYVLSICFRL